MSENLEIFVGIDIAKDTLDMGFQHSRQTVRLPHDAQGITEATKRLGEAALCLVVIEATGGLETPLAATLVAAGVPVAVVNPRQARDYAKVTGQLAKTDRVDALVLADFARAIRPELRRSLLVFACPRRQNNPKHSASGPRNARKCPDPPEPRATDPYA